MNESIKLDSDNNVLITHNGVKYTLTEQELELQIKKEAEWLAVLLKAKKELENNE